MTTATLTLSDFLLARIAADEEAAAEAMVSVGTGMWQVEADDSHPAASTVRGVDGVGVVREGDGGLDREVCAHIARHDPARVLAECEAKRRMFVALASAHAASEVWLTRGRNEILAITDQALRLMAQPYAEHPDYREEWRA